MLTEEEKKEMLYDSQKISRRDDLRKTKKKIPNKIVSLDNYIQFIDDLQKIYGPFKISKTPTPAHNYKL